MIAGWVYAFGYGYAFGDGYAVPFVMLLLGEIGLAPALGVADFDRGLRDDENMAKN